MSGQFGDRLTKSRIEHKPKVVLSWEHFFDRADVANNPALQDDLDDLIDHITKGKGIPERYYRKSVGVDHLLKRHGIMHLHLQHAGSDAVVYLVQFEDEVLLLGIGSHAELARDAVRSWRARGAFNTSADKRAAKKRAIKPSLRTGKPDPLVVAAAVASLKRKKYGRPLYRSGPKPPPSPPPDDEQD